MRRDVHFRREISSCSRSLHIMLSVVASSALGTSRMFYTHICLFHFSLTDTILRIPLGTALQIGHAARPVTLMRTAQRARASTMDATFIADPSFNLAAGSAILGTICGGLEDIKSDVNGEAKKLPTAPLFGLGAIVFTLFGAFIAFQTATLRFTFDDSEFSLVKADLSTTGENVVVGGENRWKYDTFVNWDFLPSEDFPILVYFRETQTPAASREEVPLVVDELDGQVHFFPAISNAQQLKQQFNEHRCAKI